MEVADASPKAAKIDYGPDAEVIWGPALADLEALHQLFTPYSSQEFQGNPALYSRVSEQAYPHLTAVKAALRRYLNMAIFGREAYDPHRSPKADGLKEFNAVQASIGRAYPIFFSKGVGFVQALFLNIIFWDMVGEVYASASNHSENKHAKRIIETFKEEARQGAPSANMASLIRQVSAIKEFTLNHTIDSTGLDYLSVGDLRRINEEMHTSANQHRSFPVPLAVSHEPDLCRKPVCLVSDRTPEQSAAYGYNDTELTVYDVEMERTLINPGVLDSMRAKPTREMHSNQVIIFGKSFPLLINRFSGDIRSLMISEEALRILLGEKTYEALRAYLLLRYGQLVCEDPTFTEVFRRFITEEDTPPKHGNTGGSSNGKKPPEGGVKEKKLPVRFFPRASRLLLNRTTASQRPASEGKGHSLAWRRSDRHRRLLPADCKPTDKAYQQAQEAGVDLAAYFQMVYEILDAETVFSDPQLQQNFSEGRYIFTYEEMLREALARSQAFPAFISEMQSRGTVRERNFTYVTGHEFGDPPEAVRARFRQELNITAQI